MTEWISVDKQMPLPEQWVFAHFTNSCGKGRTIRAYYAPKFTIEAGEHEMEYEAAEYCEETDNYYLREGWYECNEFEETNWQVDEKITHWMKMPKPPTSIGGLLVSFRLRL